MPPPLTPEAVTEALRGFTEPYLGADLVSVKAVKDVEVDEGRVGVKLVLGFPVERYRDRLRAAVEEHLRQALGPRLAGRALAVAVEWRVDPHTVQRGVPLLKSVKNVIAVASGKGGVGKSTVAANIALALAGEGARVGVLDADIYGPSQPRMLGAHERPESKDGKSLEPVVSYGVQAMSIGFLIEEETPMIWRGPMVTQALEQLLRETRWQDVDYMIVDLPPGTGDIQLTLAQKIPVSGAIIVTTPQDIALLDARKGLKMFEKVDVPVLGIVENMSLHVCSQCGHTEHVFGAGGGEQMARQYGVQLLGQLPLDIHVREDADGGQPTAVKDPDGPVGRAFIEVARRLAARLSRQPRDYSQAFGNIEIQGGPG